MDVYDTDDSTTIEVELPGMNKDSVKVRVNDGYLELSGERKIEKTDQQKNWTCTERSYGAFVRYIQLPKGVTEKDVKATFDKGLLKVVVPHPASPKKEGHEVPIQETTEMKESSS